MVPSPETLAAEILRPADELGVLVAAAAELEVVVMMTSTFPGCVTATLRRDEH
jgi:hypothetical protein